MSEKRQRNYYGVIAGFAIGASICAGIFLAPYAIPVIAALTSNVAILVAAATSFVVVSAFVGDIIDRISSSWFGRWLSGSHAPAKEELDSKMLEESQQSTIISLFQSLSSELKSAVLAELVKLSPQGTSSAELTDAKPPVATSQPEKDAVVSKKGPASDTGPSVTELEGSTSPAATFETITAEPKPSSSAVIASSLNQKTSANGPLASAQKVLSTDTGSQSHPSAEAPNSTSQIPTPPKPPVNTRSQSVASNRKPSPQPAVREGLDENRAAFALSLSLIAAGGFGLRKTPQEDAESRKLARKSSPASTSDDLISHLEANILARRSSIE